MDFTFFSKLIHSKTALYAISVRRFRILPLASFGFHLTMNTLALCSASIEKLLDEGVFINESNKPETESELEKIKILLRAIIENKVVSLQMVMPRQFNGKFFYGNSHRKEIIPYYLFLYDGRYILIGLDKKRNDLDYFEVAFVKKLVLLDKTTASQINICLNRKGYDLIRYIDERNNLYTSNFETLTLLCDNIIQQDVKRKFGSESLLLERPFNKFMIIVNITDRRNFFDWLLQMDSKAEILGPHELQIQFVEHVKQRYTDYLKQYRL